MSKVVGKSNMSAKRGRSSSRDDKFEFHLRNVAVSTSTTTTTTTDEHTTSEHDWETLSANSEDKSHSVFRLPSADSVDPLIFFDGMTVSNPNSRLSSGASERAQSKKPSSIDSSTNTVEDPEAQHHHDGDSHSELPTLLPESLNNLDKVFGSVNLQALVSGSIKSNDHLQFPNDFIEAVSGFGLDDDHHNRGATSDGPAVYNIQCLLQAATSPSQRTDEDTLTYLNQGQTYSIRLTANSGSYRTAFNIRLLYGKKTSALTPQVPNAWGQKPKSLIEIDKLASAQISDIKCITSEASEGGFVFSWETSSTSIDPITLAFRVNCLSTDFATHRRGEKGAFLQLELATVVGPKDSFEVVDVSTCLIKVFKGGAERRLKQDQDKVQKAAEVKGKLDVEYRQSERETYLKHSPRPRDSTIDRLMFDDAAVGIKVEAPSSTDTAHGFSSNFSSYGNSDPLVDNEDDDVKLRRCARPRVALKVSENSSMADVQQWLSENYFTDFKSSFRNYNGHSLLNLSKSDFIEICNAAEGIRLYTTLRLGRDPVVDSRATPSLSVTTYTQTSS